MKKNKLLVIALAVMLTLCALFALTACNKGDKSGDTNAYAGTYDEYANGVKVANSWIKLEANGTWSDSDEMSGTYTVTGEKIVFYVTEEGETVEFMDAVIKDGTITVDIMGTKYTYSKNAPAPAPASTGFDKIIDDTITALATGNQTMTLSVDRDGDDTAYPVENNKFKQESGKVYVDLEEGGILPLSELKGKSAWFSVTGNVYTVKSANLIAFFQISCANQATPEEIAEIIGGDATALATLTVTNGKITTYVMRVNGNAQTFTIAY